MNHNSAKKLVTAGLFAGLACAATLSIRIPTPGTGGYIHPGDGIVILCGLFFSPGWAMLTAGVGSALADLLGGYFIYVPITFLIKGLTALFTSLLFSSLSKNQAASGLLSSAAGSLTSLWSQADIFSVSPFFMASQEPLQACCPTWSKGPADWF